jgi:hypothetical protein
MMASLDTVLKKDRRKERGFVFMVRWWQFFALFISPSAFLIMYHINMNKESFPQKKLFISGLLKRGKSSRKSNFHALRFIPPFPLHVSTLV